MTLILIVVIPGLMLLILLICLSDHYIQYILESRSNQCPPGDFHSRPSSSWLETVLLLVQTPPDALIPLSQNSRKGGRDRGSRDMGP